MDVPGVDPEHPNGAVSSRLRMLGWFYLGFSLAILLLGSFLLFFVLLKIREPKGAPIPVFILGVGFFSAWGGWSLLKGQRYNLCVMVAGASLICFPVGTVMGYATLQALLEPEAQTTFQAGGGTVRRTIRLAVVGAIAFILMILFTITLDR